MDYFFIAFFFSTKQCDELASFFAPFLQLILWLLYSIMDEVKSQFAERAKAIAKDGSDKNWKPDYTRCVSIATKASVVEMIIPGAMAVFFPIIVGFALGAKALAGMLVGSIASGFLLAVTMANAGGAWDNAKKYVEAGHIEGHRKRSDLHKATVTGDTVGDPFKDTSGPSLNILIKLMSIVALVFAPVFPFQPYEKVGVSSFDFTLFLFDIIILILWFLWVTVVRYRTCFVVGIERCHFCDGPPKHPWLQQVR